MWKYALENEANEFAYKKSFIIVLSPNNLFYNQEYTIPFLDIYKYKYTCVWGGGQTEKNRKKGTFLNL